MRTCSFAVVALLASCSRFGAVYPPRPNPSEGPAIADPAPARVVVHVAMTGAAIRAALEATVPRAGDGSFAMLGSDRKYAWERGPVDVAFSQGRIVVTTRVNAVVAVPLSKVELPIDVRIDAEPIVSTEYAVKLQSLDVKVTSSDARLAVADRFAGVYEKIQTPILTQLRAFAFDLNPLLTEANTRIAKPIEIPIGDAKGCATLRVLGIEAGPTVLADGIEKDFALVVAPSIVLPCGELRLEPPPLPTLSNVATLTPGPFTVTVPIAARYDELARAMSATFTDGKLFFSTEYPGLYMEKPEIYESQGKLVLKLHIKGPVHALGIDTDLDGDLFLTGHPAVNDNELAIPDLEPTIETRSFLLSLKALTAGDTIRDQARAALRLDIGERLRSVRAKLGSELTFESDKGCFKGDVDRVEVTGVHPHAAYLRVYVAVTARARLMMPCAVE